MKIFNLFAIASTRLFLTHVSNKVNNSLQASDLLNRYLYSEFSLFEGVLALDTPAIHNLRFFGPFTERYFEQATEDIWFKSYRSKDGADINKIIKDPDYTLSYVACKLFPSVGEPELNIRTTHPSNFANVLDCSKINVSLPPTNATNSNLNKNYLHFLAGLLFCCTKKNDKVTGQVKVIKHGLELEIVKDQEQKSIYLIYKTKAKNANTVKTSKKRLVENLNALLSIENNQLKKSPLNSRVLIKAFIVSYLKDKKDVLEFMKYLEKDLINYFKTNCICEHISQENNSLIFETLELAYFYSNIFPYYRNPPKSFLIPFYLGNDKFTDKSDRFSNCVESAIYHFLNCLLWNPHTNSYTIVYRSDTVNQELAPISMIFKGNCLQKNPSEDDMEVWHKLIEGLPEGKLREVIQNPSTTAKNDLFKSNSFQNIFYNQTTNNGVFNELNPGFINALKIIEHVTGRGKKYTSQIKQALIESKWNINDATDRIEKIIKDLIIDILGSDEYLQKSLIDIKNFTNIMNGTHYQNYDFYGELKVIKKCKNFPNLEFKLTVQESHEFLGVSSPKLDPSRSFLRVEHAEDLKNLIPSANAPLENLFKYIYFVFLDIMNLNDKISEELRLNLDNSISTIKNTRIVLAGNDRLEVIFENAYAYSYEFLLFFQLQSDTATAERLSAAFKDIKNYIKQIEENHLLPKNLTIPSNNQKIANPLSKIASNLFKSIPMDDYGTFDVFKKLHADNIEFFFNLDCFDNDYYRKKGLEELYCEFNLSQVEIDKILEKVNDELPANDKNNSNKIITRFLYEIIKNKKEDFPIRNSIQLLSEFQACYSFLNMKNINLDEKFILKIQNLFYFIQYRNDFRRSKAFLDNCGTFYAEILDKMDLGLRKEFYCKLFGKYLYSNHNPRRVFNDVNYLLINDSELAIDLMQSSKFSNFTFDFLCFKIYADDKDFIEVVSRTGSYIKTKLFWESFSLVRNKFSLTTTIYSAFYQLQVYFICLNKINESLESLNDFEDTIIGLQKIRTDHNYQKLLRAINYAAPRPLLKEDTIEIQKLYTNLYILLENIIINLKIFYKDLSEKINYLDKLLILMVPYYSNELSLKEIYDNHFESETKKECHLSGYFDTKKIADGFSEFFKIIEELEKLLED